jgi:hypothetical protein
MGHDMWIRWRYKCSGVIALASGSEQKRYSHWPNIRNSGLSRNSSNSSSHFQYVMIKKNMCILMLGQVGGRGVALGQKWVLARRHMIIGATPPARLGLTTRLQEGEVFYFRRSPGTHFLYIVIVLLLWSVVIRPPPGSCIRWKKKNLIFSRPSQGDRQ